MELPCSLVLLAVRFRMGALILELIFAIMLESLHLLYLTVSSWLFDDFVFVGPTHLCYFTVDWRRAVADSTAVVTCIFDPILDCLY